LNNLNALSFADGIDNEDIQVMLNDRLLKTIIASALSWFSCSTLALSAESVTYSRATKNLAAGDFLSRSNIREVSSKSERPKGAISGSSILYGCKLYQPLKKNQAVTDAEVCAGRWDPNNEPKSSDAPWVKAQKASEVALKTDNYETAAQECERALSELESLASKGDRITDFTEMTHLLIPYTEVELATWRAERHKHGNLEQRAQSLVERAQKELSQSQRLLTAMKKLLPADNFYVVTQMKDVQHKTEDLVTAENLSNMANSMSSSNAPISNPKQP
jgi:hypothetical protein